MNILNPAFKYVPACATDIRKTFERVRQAQELDFTRTTEQETRDENRGHESRDVQ